MKKRVLDTLHLLLKSSVTIRTCLNYSSCWGVWGHIFHNTIKYSLYWQGVCVDLKPVGNFQLSQEVSSSPLITIWHFPENACQTDVTGFLFHSKLHQLYTQLLSDVSRLPKGIIQFKTDWNIHRCPSTTIFCNSNH